MILGAFFAMLGMGSARAQFFEGTNAPGARATFSFSVAPGTTNISLLVTNSAAAWSHLLLKREGTPTDTDYDFIAQFNGATNNAIHLELPELSATNYGLVVRTPPSSAAHSFRVTLTNDVAGLRSATRPASKPQTATITGALTNTQWHYFRVEIPSNSPGWRMVLNSTGSVPANLYVQREGLPTTGTFIKSGTGQTNATIILTAEQATPGAYFIGVHQPSGSSTYTLYSETGYLNILAWDPGLASGGTLVFSNAGPAGGDYYFKIDTQNPAIGVWRTALKVLSGEAEVHLSSSFAETSGGYSYHSTRAGDDGFVLHSSQFTPGQPWYLLVRARPAASWTLLSGNAFAHDLGSLAADASTSTNAAIGPEGVIFYRTTIPSETLAWRLWLNGATNTLYVKKSFAPLPGYSELNQARRLLVVPPYLAGGTFNGSYFVSVPGNPGDVIALESRQQPVADLAFATNINVTVINSEFPYRTFRVQVPVQQIAWQINLVATSGDASVAVRRDRVPNEFRNDAFSEVPAPVHDSVTLVPGAEGLADGSYFITVYGSGAFNVSLTNSNPVITSVPYEFSVTNDAPGRAGWRYYALTNIAEQLGSLGWELLLSNAPAGTEIALRRNAVPGRWNRRDNDNSLSEGGVGNVDFSGVTGFLQRPGHQADIWYIGIYSRTSALGDFHLTGRALVAEPTSFDYAIGVAVTNQPVGSWQYFRVEVPTNMLGWDLRLESYANNLPQLYVRRDLLPPGGFWPGLFPQSQTLSTQTNWNSGWEWAVGDDYRDGYSQNPDGSPSQRRVMTVFKNNPVQTGTYYLGVFANAVSTYRLISRGIGDGFSIPAPVDLAFGLGASLTVSNLPAREAAYVRIVVPSNAPTWRVRLTPIIGSAHAHLNQTWLPGSTLYNYYISYPGYALRIDQQRSFLPIDAETNIAAGTYYLAVMSEGVNPSGARIGSNSVTVTLHSEAVPPVIDLGTLSTPDLLVTNLALPALDAAFYRFTVPPETLSLEVRLENRVGNPYLSLRNTNALLGPYFSDRFNGGWNPPFYDDDLITLANPAAGTYSVTVSVSAALTNSYVLRVHAVTAAPLAFDGGGSTATVTNQPVGTWQYFRVEVPTNMLGWDLRLESYTNNLPGLNVRRDLLPPGGGWPGSWPVLSAWTNWDSGWEWGVGTDYRDSPPPQSGRNHSQNPDGSPAPRVMTVFKNNPLQPGTYYLGVLASGVSTYRLVSRGIGDGFSIPAPVDVAFGPGSSLTFSNLPAREAAYVRVIVPSNAPTWRLRLAPVIGSAHAHISKTWLPGSTLYSSDLSDAPGRSLRIDQQGSFLPIDAETNIAAGTYYLAVMSEGVNPSGARIGSNSVTVTLHSEAVPPAIDLGTLSATDLLVTNLALPALDAAFYRFAVPPGTLSLEVRLENRVGNPYLSLRNTNALLSPLYLERFTGGWNSGLYDDDLITLANPAAGVYSVVVSAPTVGLTNSYVLRVHAVTAAPLAFDGGGSIATVTNQPVGTWQYFRVEVPTNMVGWDLRLESLTNNLPQLSVRRDLLPPGGGWPQYTTLSSQTNWDSGWQWWAGDDYRDSPPPQSGRNHSQNPDGSPAPRVMTVFKNNPLQPGTYYLGVLASGVSTYRLVSRGIGDGFSIPAPVDVAFGPGTSLTVSNLLAREATYVRIVVPSNAPTWRVRLEPVVGSAHAHISKTWLPGSTLYYTGVADVPGIAERIDRQRSFLPIDAETNIAAGTYYLAVMSEGVNPSGARIGSNSVTVTLRSEAVPPVIDLGTLSATDLLVTNLALPALDAAFYRFSVPPGTLSLEVRLENRVGNPYLNLRNANALLMPWFSERFNGGWNRTLGDDDLITVANPATGLYSVVVSASGTPASYVLRVRFVPASALSFSGELNTETRTNVMSGVLADNQRAYFRVDVPALVAGAPVLGWKLDVIQNSGSPAVRVRKNLLPSDDTSSDSTYFAAGSFAVAPPFLTNGVWYVEVKGSGSTDFTLVSSAITSNTVQRLWVMPGFGETNHAPGLTLPEFGDTGTDTNGTLLPGDRGVDLEQGRFHYYAVWLPTNNAGLLRTELQAISGNPNLYLRAGSAPATTHSAIGPILQYDPPLVDRSLTGSQNTEYGNWVPLNGRSENRLTPGLWVLAVEAAGNSNVRYRLRLSTGAVQELGSSGSYSNQNLAAGDWRYYRVSIPSNAPAAWNISFNQQLGDVVMYLRDTTPPGQATTVSDWRDWSSDSKNQGPYPSFDPPGSYAFTTPPLRPGHSYYVGFRALNDAQFSITTVSNGSVIEITNSLAFYGGFVTNTLPPNGTMLYRVDVPADAARWKSAAVHDSTVRFFVEQGTIPLTSGTHYQSSGANSAMNYYLLNPNGWPWVPAQSYYLLVTNTSASAQPFSFALNGRTFFNDDEDNDGLPDYWERQHFAGSLAYIGASDPDGDGVSNLNEFLNGTSPLTADPFSLSQPSHGSNGRFQFLFSGPNNGRYRAEFRTNLNIGAWSSMGLFTNAGGTRWIIDSNAPASSQRFYRAVVP